MFQASMERIHTQAQVPQSQIAGLGDQVLSLAGKVGFARTRSPRRCTTSSRLSSRRGSPVRRRWTLLKMAAEGAKIGGSNLVDTTNALDAAIVAGIPGAERLQAGDGRLERHRRRRRHDHAGPGRRRSAMA